MAVHKIVSGTMLNSIWDLFDNLESDNCKCDTIQSVKQNPS